MYGKKIEYKFDERKLIEEFQNYVDKTYDEHYATDKYQATDIIIDSGLGTGFCLGNVIKYAKRYGRKGDSAEWRKDVMKVLHYALIQLYIHDTEHNKEKLDKTAPFHHNGKYSIDNATSEEWNEVNRKLISDSGGVNPDVFNYSD